MDVATTLNARDSLMTLLGQMNAERRLQFKFGMVVRTLWWVAGLLPDEKADHGERVAVKAAQHWLRDLSDSSAREVEGFLVAEAVDGGIRHHDYDPLFTAPAGAAAVSPELAAEIVVRTAVAVDRRRKPDAGMCEEEVQARTWNDLLNFAYRIAEPVSHDTPPQH
ncbi:MAG: hypothetical protein C0467_20465 [Planctomycetaceae bacterium]|nr:hypothetical protein [Planctomycetaceae bacterium]